MSRSQTRRSPGSKRGDAKQGQKGQRLDASVGDSSGDITFVQHVLPPLPAGALGVSVSQTILNGTETLECFTNNQAIAVLGQRFSIDPSQIVTVFPPDTHSGQFANVLAHVVLSAPTLPWQRSPVPPRAASAQLIDSTPPADVPPWLAVLTFDELDKPPKIDARTVADLKTANGVFAPTPSWEVGQSDSDPVSTVDVPLDLFNAICPSLNDLKWLAHVRECDPGAKATVGDQPPASQVAVVIGNRLPLPGHKSTAMLVSLEGFADYLPADDGTPSTAFPKGTNAVRLVVIRSWSFTAVDEKQTFSGLLEALDDQPSVLQLPFVPSSSDADATVQNAFQMGYVPMAHDLRDGDTSVSWYRGPLLPFATTPFLQLGNQSSDSLLRYDPTSGLFDVSYAVAWQLGLNQALHDRNFSLGLYQWKRSQVQQSILQLEQEVIDQLQSIAPDAQEVSSASDASTLPDNLQRVHHALTRLVGPTVQRLQPNRQRDWVGRRALRAAKKQRLASSRSPTESNNEQ